MKIRESSRAIIINEKREVLLLKFIQNKIVGNKVFWVFPGGGVKQNETYEQTLLRELEEETGIKEIESYTLVWKRNILLNGKKGEFISREHYFLVKCDYSDITNKNFTENEKDTFISKKWWSLDELRKTNEPITIPRLHHLIEKLLSSEMISPIDLYE